MSCKPRHLNKFVSLATVSLGGTLSFASLGIYRGDETFYSNVIMPFVAKYIDPELAHESCIFLTKNKLIRCQDKLSPEQTKKLQVSAFDKTFQNPVGLAAGFDKNSHALEGLPYYGLGFSEVGTVTPKPQDGNPKKRIFRIPELKSLINRCGFNNVGIDHVADHLSGLKPFDSMLVGLNLGKNKETKDISSDYIIGLEKSKDLSIVDYIVINLSSPNTPGLRDSQEGKNLELLLDDVLRKMEQLQIRKPLLIKLAPDLTTNQLKDIVDVIGKKRNGQAKVSGVILTNTTISRPDDDETLEAIRNRSKVFNENGGLSGPPLRDMSTKMISDFYRLTNGKIPIIGVGGISSGQDAYEKIKAGASLVQLYTSLTYEGPPIVNKIKRELIELLERDNLESVTQAIGLNHKKN